MRFMLIKVSTEWYRSVFNTFPGGQFRLYIVILTLLVWNKQTVEDSWRWLQLVLIMDQRPRYNASSSFSIDNILSDRKEEQRSSFPFEYQHQGTPDYLQHSAHTTYPPQQFHHHPLGSAWSSCQPYSCPPFDRSRKTTGKFI